MKYNKENGVDNGHRPVKIALRFRISIVNYGLDKSENKNLFIVSHYK